MGTRSLKSKLPVLRVHIPAPCEMDWGEMDGDALRRRCAQCDREVHDLSALSREEARALLRSREPLCVRGNFTDTGVLVSHADLARGRARAAARAALVTAAALSASGCESEPRPYIIVTPQGEHAAVDGDAAQEHAHRSAGAGGDAAVNTRGDLHEVNAQAHEASARVDVTDAGCGSAATATKGKRRRRKPVVMTKTGTSARPASCVDPQDGDDPLCGL